MQQSRTAAKDGRASLRAQINDRVFHHADVGNLIQAMASFAPPVAGENSLPTHYQNKLAPLIVAN